MRLNNKKVLITGAGSGIGQACAKLFFNEGARIVLTDLNIETLESTANILSSEVFRTGFCSFEQYVFFGSLPISLIADKVTFFLFATDR